MDHTTTISASPSIDADASESLDGLDKDELFRVLVTRHQSRLQRFVLRHIGHPDDADDIAQRAFMEAARTIESFRGQSQLSTWLYGIAMNLVRNYLNRAPHRLHHFESDDQLDTMPSLAHDDPVDVLSRQQTMRKLVASMEELPSSMQEVLMLVAVDEMSYEDAAAILSVPVGTNADIEQWARGLDHVAVRNLSELDSTNTQTVIDLDAYMNALRDTQVTPKTEERLGEKAVDTTTAELNAKQRFREALQRDGGRATTAARPEPSLTPGVSNPSDA